nr:PhzF family phenazine biosynthesis protein [Consotaella salsifontis]
MGKTYPYFVVDAFADRVFSGNPAAVVPLDAFLSDATMQAIAAANNLSETAFVVPDGEHHRLRWFTPTKEVPLCGHATLASAFVLRETGTPGPWTFETASGVLRVDEDEDLLVLDFPAWESTAVTLAEELVAALGATPKEVHRARDLICVFGSPDQIAALAPDHRRLAALGDFCVIATAKGGEGVDITSRYFAAAHGIDEDPVTGVAHVQLAPFWAKRIGKNPLICRQASRRGGILRAEVNGERVRIAGRAVLYARGEFILP